MRRASWPACGWAWLLALALVGPACTGPGERVAGGRAQLIGGAAAGPADQPATGALVQPGKAGAAELVCTGTLIAPRAVLTAAHCFVLDGNVVPDFSLAPAAAAAYSGALFPVYSGLRFHAHPDFKLAPPASRAHDIAILELAEAVTAVAPARLPATADAVAALGPGAPVVLTGYGATDEAGTGAGLKNVGAAAIVSLGADEVVIGGAARDCTGDSGGPSTAQAAGWLVGVTSRSAIDDAPCAGNAIHTRVDAHHGWIDGVLADIERPAGGCSVAPGARVASGPWLLAVLLGVAARLIAAAARRGCRGRSQVLEYRRALDHGKLRNESN